MRYSHNRSVKNDKKNDSENKMRRVATIGFCIFGIGLLGFSVACLVSTISRYWGLVSVLNIGVSIIIISYGLILSLSAYICYLLNKLLLKTTKKTLNIYIFAIIISVILCALLGIFIRKVTYK